MASKKKRASGVSTSRSKSTSNKRTSVPSRADKPTRTSALKQKQINEEKELRKIERTLDEEFESLAQARRALKREQVVISERVYKAKKQAERVTKAATERGPKLTVKATPYPSRELTEQVKAGHAERERERISKQKHGTRKLTKPLISLRDLTIREKKKTLDAFMNEDNRNLTRLGNELKEKDEMFYAKIPYKVRGRVEWASTKDAFKTLGQLFRKLNEYKKKTAGKGISNSAWLNTIQIGRFKGTEQEYKTMREQEKQQRIRERKKIPVIEMKSIPKLKRKK